MMMSAKEVLHSLSVLHPEPEELFKRANERLYELWSRSFLAIGYFGVHSTGGTLRYLVAGQPQPLKRNNVGKVEELELPPHRLPLGAMLHGEYEALEVTMQPGELVIAYSDGVIEAQSPDGEFFGSERLVSAFETAPCDPESAVAYILSVVNDFTAGNDPYDDITLLAIRRTGKVANA